MHARSSTALARLLVLGAALTACADGGTPTALIESDQRPAVVSQAPVASAVQFLPPLVSAAPATGAFDPAANPVVEVCVPFGSGCATPFVARFTMGSGSESIRFDAAAGHYIVNWNLRNHAVDRTRTYRIRVRAGAAVGYVDVKPDRANTIPIKFRVAQVAPLPAGEPHFYIEANGGSAEIGPAGGSVVATGSNGVGYTLQVPPGALRNAVAIRMTPIAGAANLGIEGGLAAGVRFEPEGLQFLEPALLTMQFQGAVNGETLFGFVSERSESELRRALVLVQGSVVRIPIAHFSLTGAGSGSGPSWPCSAGAWQCIEEDVMERLAFVMQMIALQQRTGADVTMASLAEVLAEWSTAIVAELGATATGSTPDAYNGFLRSVRWLKTVQLLGVDADLMGEVAAVRAAQRTFLASRIDFLDAACRGTVRIGDRIEALGWAADGHKQGLVDSPYTPAEVDVWHCGTPVIEQIDLAPMKWNEQQVAAVRFGVVYAGLAVTASVPLKLRVTVSGTTANGTFEMVTAQAYSREISPAPGSRSVSLSANACFAIPAKSSICGQKGKDAEVEQPIIVTVSPKNAKTKTNEPFQFSATVQNAEDKSVSWVSDGGSITREGVFTSANPGTFTVWGISNEDMSTKESAEIIVTSAAQARLEALTCSVNWGHAASAAHLAGAPAQQVALTVPGPLCTNGSARATSSDANSYGSGTANVTANYSGSGANAEGNFERLTLTGNARIDASASGTATCDGFCAEAGGNFQGGMSVVISATSHVVLDVELTMVGICDGQLGQTQTPHWGSLYNQWGWLPCTGTQRFSVSVLPGQPWSYTIGMEMTEKVVAYGRNASWARSAVTSFTLEAKVRVP